MDENLFYKGVDKRVVQAARLHQTHSLSEPNTEAEPSSPPENTPGVSDHPPYPFTSGNSLLALTKKHNVSPTIVIRKVVSDVLLDDHRTNRL